MKAEELQEYLDAGWFSHPDDLLKDVPEPEPEPEEQRKSGSKPKAAADETDTKGDLVLAALRKLGVASNATLTDVEPQSMEDGVNDAK